MKSDEERCLAAGMDGYLSKPVTSRGPRRGPGALRARARRAGAVPPVDLAVALRAHRRRRRAARRAERALRRRMARPAGRAAIGAARPWMPRVWSAPPTASRACSARSAPEARPRSRPASRRSRETATSTPRPRRSSSSKARWRRSSPSCRCLPGRGKAIRPARGAAGRSPTGRVLYSGRSFSTRPEPGGPHAPRPVACSDDPAGHRRRLRVEPRVGAGGVDRAGVPGVSRRDRRGREVAAGLGDGPDRGARARSVPAGVVSAC